MTSLIRVYLDQMVVSNAAESVDWRTKHYLGAFLAPLIENGSVCVRPSLAHFSETVLYVDADEENGCALLDTSKLDKRQRIAQIVCALSDFDQAIPRWEVLALSDLARLIAELVETSIDMKALEELRRLDRIWLKAQLTTLSADRMAHNAGFYAHAWSSKLRRSRVSGGSSTSSAAAAA
jgi:hypothetical protein